jgi:hypothetical protein
MTFKLKQNVLTLAMLVGVAAFVGCASTSSKPVEQANAKPSATTETKTTEIISKGDNNVETKTVQKTTIEEKDGLPPKTTYESTSDLSAPNKDKIGVAECDQYLEKYEACVKGKVPEAARAPMQSSIEQMRQSWKDVAAHPQAKTTLAAGCKQAQEAAKQTMSAYGCAW